MAKDRQYIMDDGTEVKVSLTMAQLYRLRGEDKGLYDHVCKCMTSGVGDPIDIARFVYGAYKCANPENKMAFEEFIEKMNQDINVNAAIMLILKGIVKEDEEKK